MKEENYLEGIYGCLERIEKKVETLPVEGTSPAVGNRTVPRKDCGTENPSGTPAIRGGENGLEIAAVRNHTVRLSEGWPLSAETFAGRWKRLDTA